MRSRSWTTTSRQMPPKNQSLLRTRSLIILTQSCDLSNEKISLAAMCPIVTVDAFEEINPDFSKKGEWEKVRKGRMEGLHMLPPFEDREQPSGVGRGLSSDLQLASSISTAPCSWRSATDGVCNRHFLNTFRRHLLDSSCRVGLPVSIPAFK